MDMRGRFAARGGFLPQNSKTCLRKPDFVPKMFSYTPYIHFVPFRLYLSSFFPLYTSPAPFSGHLRVLLIRLIRYTVTFDVIDYPTPLSVLLFLYLRAGRVVLRSLFAIID